MRKRQQLSFKTTWSRRVDRKPTTSITPQPVTGTTPGLVIKKKFPLKKVLIILGSVLVAILIGLAVAVWTWFNVQLAPVGDDTNQLIAIDIEPSSSPVMIGDLLEEQGVIRSSTAFVLYTRLYGLQGSLQAGEYRLSPGDTTPRIVEHITQGNVDTFTITFLPGATLADNREVLMNAGYDAIEVDNALSEVYDSPIFAGKPTGADLEGYIYGDTYQFGAGASVEDILEYTFEVYEQVVEEQDLVARYEAQGLSLFEGITLASIIQRESGGNDKQQIAQVFLLRLEIGMPLGSDVTYQYIADKTGVPRDPNLDSPYNTRRYGGLPPGPIAVPGLDSLIAVAEPAEGDYLFFLSGDDDVTYYARTQAEHEQNIVNHCQEKCLIL